MTMYDFYVQYWRPFGELLTEMEKEVRRGVVVVKRWLEVLASGLNNQTL